jgi:TPR repeat protein
MNIAYVYTVEREYTKAMTLYHIAVDKADRKALYQIGLLYRQELGVTQNYVTAMEWFLKGYTLGYKEGIEGIRSALIYTDCISGNDLLRESINHNIINRNKDLAAVQQGNTIAIKSI